MRKIKKGTGADGQKINDPEITLNRPALYEGQAVIIVLNKN